MNWMRFSGKDDCPLTLQRSRQSIRDLADHQRLLGHVKIESIARYAHLDDMLVVQCTERVGQRIERSTGGEVSGEKQI